VERDERAFESYYTAGNSKFTGKSLAPQRNEVVLAFHKVMSSYNILTMKDFVNLEAKAAENFRDYMNMTTVQHVVYLSGIANSEDSEIESNSADGKPDWWCEDHPDKC